MTSVPVTIEEIILRVKFAAWRLEDLKACLSRTTIGSRFGERLQLIQEFFFHLVGAREVLALLINERRRLGLDPEEVSINRVVKSLPTTDPMHPILRELTVDPRNAPFPSDPYSDAGYIYRAVLYRNQAAHRHRTPMHLELQDLSGRKKYFLHLDPRNPAAGPSKIEALPELTIIRDHLSQRYQRISKAL